MKSIVSRFLTLFAAVCLGAPLALAQSLGGAIAKPQPLPTSYGIVSESVQVIGASAFQTYDPGEAMTFASSSIMRYTSTAVGATDYLVAPVNLPSGSMITRIEYDGCNNNTLVGMSVELYRGTGSAGLTLLGQGGAGAANSGCGLASANLAHQVDNGFAYLILWNPGGTGNVITDGTQLLNAVRIYYKLQVSPAPVTPTFTDVPLSDSAFQFIEAFNGASITVGCQAPADPPAFCPDGFVTRRQMAVFFAKALGLHFAP